MKSDEQPTLNDFLEFNPDVATEDEDHGPDDRDASDDISLDVDPPANPDELSSDITVFDKGGHPYEEGPWQGGRLILVPDLIDPDQHDPIFEDPPDDHIGDPEYDVEGRCSHCGSQFLGPKAEESPFREDPCKQTGGPLDCDCCSCPECGSPSIYYRESLSPSYSCFNCSNEFGRPVRPGTDVERDLEARVLCLSCGRATHG